ncbi:MAG: HlyC/CorC family transporter [Clostridia bacterium]|nr:HlyC/CorC family transporter [Clostridia bacterium]
MFSQLITLVILILLNAYFAMSEIAFISLNDTKIEKQAREGNKKAKQIEKMLKNPSKFLATIQIGITLAGFLSSAFAADTFASMLATALNGAFPNISIEIFRGISIVIITIILSFFTLVFGELVPKRIAMKYYEKVAYATIGIIRTISIITAPFVKVLTFSTNVVSKLFGISEQEEEIVTEEEIKMMIDEGEENGTIDLEEKEMIHNIFDFDDRTASEVMTHRIDVYAIDINSNIEDIIKEIDEYKYSRIPVYEETIDEIKGILYVKDLLKYYSNGKTIKIKNIIREAYFVTENKPINDLFKELQKNKMQMAIVIDEYGGTAGVVTMEDILEEIVGNIFDEYDEVEDEYQKIDENTFLINGSVSINDLKKILQVDIPDGDYETLSGYLLDLIGRVPEEQELPMVETDKVVYKIEEFEDKRILWVKACIVNEVSQQEDGSKDNDKE